MPIIANTRFRRGFVDSPDGQIHYVIGGKGDPVVFLHPSPQAWNYFLEAAPMVAERFTFIGMDTMGYGDSDRPNPPYKEMGQYARAVTWLMDGLNLPKASVVGHLTGSQIATELAAAHPDRVDKLVLSEVFNWDKPERFAVHEKIHNYELPNADGSYLIKLWNRGGARLDVLGLDKAERLFLNQLKVNTGPQPVEAYGHMGWDGAAPWVMCHTPFWERVEVIEAPTLILHGKNSDLVRINANIPPRMKRAKSMLYEARGMGGPLESPEEWTRIVIDFLTDPGI